MKKIKHLLFIGFLLIPFLGRAQNDLKNTWTVPATYSMGDKVDWYFEFNLPASATSFSDGENLYLWAWNPSEPDAGNWGNSSAFAGLTYVGNMVWKMEIDPKQYFNMTTPELNAQAEKNYWLLLKNQTGSKQTDAIGVPFAAEVLPLTFTKFMASTSKKDDVVTLRWETASEINSSHFNILHSADGLAWTTVGEIKCKNQAHNTYTFEHFQPITANNYYKLQQVDGDGSFTYSEIRTVNFSLVDPVVKVYPNPVKETLKVYLPHQLIGKNYAIYNITGAKVNQGLIDNTYQTVEFGAFTKGMYFLKIDGEIPIKIVKY